MKLLFPSLFLAFTSSCVVIGGMNEKVTSDETLSFEPSGTATHLVIDSFNGGVTLEADESATGVHGEARSYARGHTVEEAEQRLSQMKWEFSQEGETVHLRLKRPAGKIGNMGSTIRTMRVPAGWAISVDTSNGNVTVSPGLGAVDVKSSNGSVHVAGDQEVEVYTSNGNVEYQGASADFLLESSNGSVRVMLDGDWSGKGRVVSSNGNISVKCSGVIDASMKSSTSNGKTRVHGPELNGSGGTLNLSTSNGSITVTHGETVH